MSAVLVSGVVCFGLHSHAAADCCLSDVTDTEQSKNLLQSESTAGQTIRSD